jgi:ABC-type glycerol-3-phosphate transport system substrate-binding protein
MARKVLTSYIVLALCLLLPLVMSACQTAVQPTPSAQPVLNLKTATPTATPLPGHLDLSAEELQGIELTLWSPWLDDWGDQFGYLVEDFNLTNMYGITILPVTWGGDMALMDALAAVVVDPESLPDIFIARPEEAFRLQQSGLPLQVMDDYMASAEWGLSAEEWADLIEPAWQLGQTGGEQYGVPAETNAGFLFYNLTWGLELGFNGPPKTREDFLLQACKASQANLNDGQRENNGTGGWLVTNDSVGMLAWLSTFDFPLPDEAPYTFNLPETKSTLDYLKNLLAKDCAWLGKASTPYDYFTNRYALLVTGSLEEIELQRTAFSRAGSTDQWVLIPYPRQSGEPLVILSGSSFFLVQSDAARQMAAWIFLRWMNDPLQQLRMRQVASIWPSRISAVSAMQAELSTDLIYSYVFNTMQNARPQPHDAEWSIARRIFEDAAWQLFMPETRADQIPALLADLDATIAEMLGMGGE